MPQSGNEIVGKSWNGQRAVWRGTLCGDGSDGRIIVGVCAREKKARSKHMEAITSRLNPEKFQVSSEAMVSPASMFRSLSLSMCVYLCMCRWCTRGT